MQILLLLSIFVIGTCGLVYELSTSTLASYLLGDSVTQFSTVIGVYLFAMGLGAYLSRFIHKNLTACFIQVELLIALVGGFSSSILFLSFEQVLSFRLILYFTICVIGTLVGLELPLLLRILKRHFDFSDLVSKVFALDYVGALLASLLFPLVVVPYLGLVRACLLFGIINALVALWALAYFKNDVNWAHLLRAQALLVLALLGLGLAGADKIMNMAEAMTYPDRVIYSKSSAYQRIVVTKDEDDIRLFLNNNLQFSSRDEYRYHEALVHPGLGSLRRPSRVLVLGGGDGLAVREILKYPTVNTVTLVDLDTQVTKLFTSQPALAALNGHSFDSPKVELVTADAFVWLKSNVQKFDFIVVDFPDPSNFSLGKLYSTTFFRLLSQALDSSGCLVVQSTSPFVARKSFWCVNATLESAGLVTLPYHAFVPSFGEWGFILASRYPIVIRGPGVSGLKFLDKAVLEAMFLFPPDMSEVKTEINRLDNQVLVRYFDQEWSKVLH